MNPNLHFKKCLLKIPISHVKNDFMKKPPEQTEFI